MRWKGREQSGNVEDRRSVSGKQMVAGGTVGTIIIALIVLLLGGNPLQVLNNLQSSGQGYATEEATTVADDEMTQFVSVVLKDTEDVWNTLFTQSGITYREPRLVLYSQAIQSACGYSSAATGPFYCPGDEKVYIDLDFLEQLQQRLGARGDFAVAYIIAHEIGHHVQKQLGILDQMQNLRGKLSEAEYNQYNVRLELQADFLAGVWAHHAQKMKNILEEGDIEEAMNAAASVGDDRIQMQSQGYVVPDAFTHGTSEQRVRWFTKGFRTGDPNQGDTFNAGSL
ncbi:MAG: neutral zinc metallopeptidase [Bacteroidales bacterium]|nr:neutral zinc metallopeptidase [Bacteroidales bacterium]MBN2762196.1 neutral zinc metallopeptidase [Bacteroidales bacterium]